MKNIELTQGKFALVDDVDFDWLHQWKWRYANNGYAIRSIYLGGGRKHQKIKTIHMHREIINTAMGMETDHINGNKLDNRRENLRICNRVKNLHNIHIIRAKSGVKGVCLMNDTYRRKPWKAQITINYKHINLGYYSTLEEASEIYKRVTEKYFGRIVI